MEITHLSDTVSIKRVSESATEGVFEVEGLYAGYGLTVGNALRRALLSSLPGAAVTHIKVKHALNEFSTLSGIKEDLVEMSLNFKKLRFRMHANEPQTLFIKAKGVAKGERVVTGADIQADAMVEVVNPDVPLASITDAKTELEMEVTVERGLGYSAVEARKKEKLPVGLIAIDAFFSPVVKVDYSVENMRVGDRTDFNRLRLDITTDGTISPSSALHKVANVLKDHFEKVSAIEVQEFEVEEKKVTKKKTTKE